MHAKLAKRNYNRASLSSVMGELLGRILRDKNYQHGIGKDWWGTVTMSLSVGNRVSPIWFFLKKDQEHWQKQDGEPYLEGLQWYLDNILHSRLVRSWITGEQWWASQLDLKLVKRKESVGVSGGLIFWLVACDQYCAARLCWVRCSSVILMSRKELQMFLYTKDRHKFLE